MNLLTQTLPGVSITYYGEELGMTNNMDITFQQTVDPSGLNCGPEHYNDEVCSRDPERTPMQWNAGVNAGFNEGGSTWLPVNEDYTTVNVESQLADPSSHLAFFKGLLRQRKLDVYKNGSVNTVVSGDILAVARTLEGERVVQVSLVNFGDSTATIDLGGQFDADYVSASVVLNSLGEDSANNPPS